MNSEEIRKAADTIAAAVRAIVDPMSSRVAKLEAKIAGLEAAQKSAHVKTVPAFAPGRRYQTGEMVEHLGMLWRCEADTGAAPTLSDRWQKVDI